MNSHRSRSNARAIAIARADEAQARYALALRHSMLALGAVAALLALAGMELL